MSEDTSSRTKLFTALAKAQGQVEHATKSQKNEAFKKDGRASKYADIADVIEVIQKPASDNGLSVTFNFKSEFASDRFVHFIKYVVRHESGELLESDWVLMMLRDNTMHGFGAGNTYYRRQLLKAIYQIPEEDDDGNSQSLKKPTESVAIKPQVKNYAPGASAPYPSDDRDLDAFLNEGEPDKTYLEELYEYVENNQIPVDQVKSVIKLSLGSMKKSSDLSPEEVKKVMSLLRKSITSKEG
jgi:hypothetical protein